MQDTLLQTIARSRSSMDAVLAGRADEIASAEGLAERHVRRLVPLAFLSPKIIQAIADSTAPAGLTASSLTQALPHAWTHKSKCWPSAEAGSQA
jgi:site-specific DNA recombinase